MAGRQFPSNKFLRQEEILKELLAASGGYRVAGALPAPRHALEVPTLNGWSGMNGK